MKSRSMKRLVLATLLSAPLLAGTPWAAEPLPYLQFERTDPDVPAWVEGETVLPALPQQADLLPFYVSELTAHQFFIDASTLHVGKDGVVRYVLVVQTRGGATNISFEGIRCASREFRIYALGHQDGNWTKARQSIWRPIENKPVNRQHAALSRNLFCPDGIIISSARAGLNALRQQSD